MKSTMSNKNNATTPAGKDDVLRLQAPLLERLQLRMAQERLNQGALAGQLGITASYVTSIFSGFRWVPKSDRSVIDALAGFLGVSVLQVYIWSGFFSPEDMVAQDGLSTRLDTIHGQMIADPLVRHIAPHKGLWAEWPLETRLRFVMLYEITSRSALLDHAQMEVADTVLQKVKWVLQSA
jgi:transcriptional regulator with XRE-family HTH domain